MFIIILLLIIRITVKPSIHMISGNSMVPTVKNGDYVVTTKVKTINRYSIVVIKENNSEELLIKRVIGIPGDGIVRSGNNVSIVNKMIRNSDFLYNFRVSNETLIELRSHTHIPFNKYFVIGDNLEYSRDSRMFGLIDEEQIIEQVKGKLFPLSQFELLYKKNKATSNFFFY
ncbi:signal peptidase I [Vagococcus xieshaowenii]|nr:signal peptidase I [Vagococcus xieshaowenii]